MAKKKVLILGAGLAGLSAAWHLQKKGLNCLVFEKEREVGGLCRSKEIDGFTFDYDGHLLHFKHIQAFNLVRELLKDNLARHQRNAWVYAHKCYIPYPFQANLHGLPSAVVKECLLGLMSASHNGKLEKSKNFLEWMNCAFGKGIARHFMIPYNSKFWTLPPQEMNCEWLDGFVPVPSFSQIIEGTIGESHQKLGYNVNFWYPKKGGIQQLSLAFAARLKNIFTNSAVTEIDLIKKEITVASRERIKYDYLIYTLPLPEITHLMKGIPEKIRVLSNKLRWNSILNVNLGIEIKDTHLRHWVYFPQKSVCFFRVGFYHNFSKDATPTDANALYVEVSYSKNKPIDKNNIVHRVKDDLKKVGILQGLDSVRTVDINDIKYGYPIYDGHYNSVRYSIIKYLSRQGIIPCGRYGSWRYFSMENAILDGKRAASLV